jgi:hypothetical protein
MKRLSVIGKIWIVIGFVATIGVVNAFPYPWPWYDILLVAAQVGFGVLGLVGGVGLIKRKGWARTLLEFLTWVFMLSLVSAVFIWFIVGIRLVQAGAMSIIEALLFAPVGLATLAVFGYGTLRMLQSLRSDEVRQAIAREKA